MSQNTVGVNKGSPCAPANDDGVYTSVASSAEGSLLSPDDGFAPAHKSTRVVYREEYLDMEDNIVYETLGQTSKQEHAQELPPFEIIETAYTVLHSNPRRGADEETRGKPQVKSWGATNILIRSPAVLDTLRLIIGNSSNIDLSIAAVRIKFPFTVLVHYRDELDRLRQDFAPGCRPQFSCTAHDSTYDDLTFVLDFIEERVGVLVREETKRISRAVPTVTYAGLWLLFKSGIDVYADLRGTGDWDSYVVRDVNFYTDGTPSSLELWSLDCDEKVVGPVFTSLTLHPFLGERSVSLLQCIPRNYIDKQILGVDSLEKETQLMNRGKFWYELLKQEHCYVNFDGLSSGLPQRHFSGHAIIDMTEAPIKDVQFLSEFFEDVPDFQPKCMCDNCTRLVSELIAKRKTFAGYANINPRAQEELSSHQYWLCPSAMTAFLLKHRRWLKLRVDGFSLPKPSIGLLESLVLPSSSKTLLRSLARRYTRDRSQPAWSADFVKGKGGGMIFLLHGKPGVGKTYTAESVAQEINRPLITLTSADIGMDLDKLEERLEHWFKLGKRWGAILLIDEADVYLEQRAVNDLSRNMLVAAFLRTLEYFEGILFLTTNRVGTFDEALLSRVDVKIYYKDFTEEQRAGLWNTFFRKLQDERENDMRVHRSARAFVTEDETLLSLKWNARDIRNAFQTAVAMAEFEDHKEGDGLIAVKDEHIRQVVEMAKEFNDYLEEVHQKTSEQRALSKRLRADHVGVQQSVAKLR